MRLENCNATMSNKNESNGQPSETSLADHTVNLVWDCVANHTVPLRRLGCCDSVNDKAYTTLGDDVRDTISHLDGYNCVGTSEANHWEDVHNWVSQPAHNCPVLCTLNHFLDHRVGL